MSEHVLKLDPPAFGPDRNFLPDAVYSEDVVIILSDGSDDAQAVADAFASVGASVVSVGTDMAAAKRVSGIAAGHGQPTLDATWKSDVKNVFDEVHEALGPIDHVVMINTDEASLSSYLEAFSSEPEKRGKTRSAVIVAAPGKAEKRLADWAGKVRINAVEADLEAGAGGPVRRAGGTFELGWAVGFLCSPFAREIDGQVLKLNGGAA